MYKNYDCSMDSLIHLLSTESGVFGLFSNPGFGTTTFSIQISEKVTNSINKTVAVFSLELSEEQWLRRMESMGLSTDRVCIYDCPLPTVEYIKESINNTKNIGLVVIDYLELLDASVAREIPNLSKTYSLPIFLCGKLSRDSGDFDPFHRPEIYSVHSIRESHLKLNLYDYDYFALLHRGHDCDRGIGTAMRYNVSDKAEVIVKVNAFGKVGSFLVEWDTKKKCFDI